MIKRMWVSEDDNDEKNDNAAINLSKKVYLLPKGKTRPDHQRNCSSRLFALTAALAWHCICICILIVIVFVLVFVFVFVQNLTNHSLTNTILGIVLRKGQVDKTWAVSKRFGRKSRKSDISFSFPSKSVT